MSTQEIESVSAVAIPEGWSIRLTDANLYTVNVALVNDQFPEVEVQKSLAVYEVNADYKYVRVSEAQIRERFRATMAELRKWAAGKQVVIDEVRAYPQAKEAKQWSL